LIGLKRFSNLVNSLSNQDLAKVHQQLAIFEVDGGVWSQWTNCLLILLLYSASPTPKSACDHS